MEFRVKGMSCAHCEQTVREALGKLPGVEEVTRVDAGEGVVALTGEVDRRAVAAAIRDAGYEVVEEA